MGVTEAAGQFNAAEYSVSGMYLRGHTFKTVQAGLPAECSMRCEEEVRCQSFNLLIGRNVCELNSRTKDAKPENFISDQYWFYMKHTMYEHRFFI